MCQLNRRQKLTDALNFDNFVKIVKIWSILRKMSENDEIVILRDSGSLMNPNRKVQN